MGWTFSGSDTSLSVLSGLVSNRKLSQISTDHVELDLDVIKWFSVINSYVVSDHLGQDNSVSEVSLDWNWLLSRYAIFLALLTFGVKTDVLVLDFWYKFIEYFLRIFFWFWLWTILQLAPGSIRWVGQESTLWNYVCLIPYLSSVRWPYNYGFCGY